ncbi:hypothetical protein JXA84_07155 [candidate division WOR-3 bacterium]|nr:hypothetical protein [candidate division WOR-3 bacterium]
MNIIKCSLRKGEEGSHKPVENGKEDGRAGRILTSSYWGDYREMWRQLDGVIDYSHPDSDASELHYIYIDMSGQRSYLEKAVASLESLNEEGLLNSFETDLLSAIAESRIKYISGYLYTTRMMPTSIEIRLDRLIKTIDSRTDTVHRLMDEGKITKDQFDSALDNIVLNLETYAKISVSSEILRKWEWEIPLNLRSADINEMDIDRSLQAILGEIESLRNEGILSDSVYESYAGILEKTKADIVYIETIMPFMDTLFRDLLSHE